MKEIEKSSRVLEPRRFSMVQLLIALALLFFFVPFVEAIKGGDLIVSALLSLVLLAGVLAVASRGRTLAVALLLAIPAVAGRWLNHFQPHLVPPAIFLIAGIGLVAFEDSAHPQSATPELHEIAECTAWAAHQLP
jgi:hypothetical protein